MARKKSAKKISPTETAHFRPGNWLGGLINDQADVWGISRGAAAKQLVMFALCRLEIDSHDDLVEIATLATGSVVDAIRQVHVEIVFREHEANDSLSQEERREVVREVLARERLAHGVISQQEKTRVKIRLRR